MPRWSFAMLAGLLAAMPARADMIYWQQPAFGVYDFGTSWAGGVAPGPVDSAVYGGLATGIVSPVGVLLLQSQTAAGTQVVSGDYDLRFGNPGLTYRPGTVTIGGQYVATGPAGAARLSVLPAADFAYGGQVVSGLVLVGGVTRAGEAARPGELVLSGAGTEWRTALPPGASSETAARLAIGNGNNSGAVEVRAGASLSVETRTYVGGGFYQSDPTNPVPIRSVGTLLVDGTGSRMASESLFVGTLDRVDGQQTVIRQGTATISNGGELRAGQAAIGSLSGNLDPQQLPDVLRLTTGAAGYVQSVVELRDGLAVLDVTGGGNLSIGAVGAVPGSSSRVYVGPGGTLAGVGTVLGGVTNVGGTVSPGLSPGTLTVSGSFVQTGGSIVFEIGGLGAGQYDVLEVGGRAALTGGRVDIRFINGYLPAAGDQFGLIRAGGGVDLDGAEVRYFGLPAGGSDPLRFEGGTLFVGTAVVPAPPAVVLGAVGVVTLAIRRRRVAG